MADGGEDVQVQAAAYPAKSRSASQTIDGVDTEVTSISFSDKIMITLAQSGRINHWLHVPLGRSNPLDMVSLSQPPAYSDGGPDSSLLPLSTLTATTILGGTRQDAEVVGHTLATTLGTAILMRNSDERRMLVLGIGLARTAVDRASFDALVGLCLDVL